VLYRPETFERLADEPWDDDRVRAAIRDVVADVDAAFDPAGLWPSTEWDSWRAELPVKSLYAGAAGVLWALDALRRRGHAESGIDLAEAARHMVALWRERPDFPAGTTGPGPASLIVGATGVFVVGWRLAPDDGLADDIHALVVGDVANEADEVMWGPAGTMLGARAMLDWTGDGRWAAAWRTTADALWERRGGDGLWAQRLFGGSSRGLGPPHGVVGNVLAYLQGGELLEPTRRETLLRESAAVLERTAVVEDGLANWPTDEGADLVGEDGQIRLQWDWGAPGIVISASSYLDEELLLAGAELVWKAGPHGPEKGYGICHGTAGNGYALLKTFERTGDERWLERARAFAVHALGQLERARAERGHGRFSLWTGDFGAALFAADCLDARAGYPVLDGWD
jgi:Lanthionine synthetase C-like protein